MFFEFSSIPIIIFWRMNSFSLIELLDNLDLFGGQVVEVVDELVDLISFS